MQALLLLDPVRRGRYGRRLTQCTPFATTEARAASTGRGDAVGGSFDRFEGLLTAEAASRQGAAEVQHAETGRGSR